MSRLEGVRRSPFPVIGGSNAVTFWAALVVLCVAVGFIYYDGLAFMVHEWERPEYSYGYLVPGIALFMAWRDRGKLGREDVSGRWIGLPIIGLALVIYAAGQLATIYTLVQYSFLLLLVGVSISVLGSRNVRRMWPALAFLVFMIPLPNFLYNQLSAQLQLISSQLGVAVVRLAGISVNLEGNVIDLGTYKLQVIDACSGLRYLFPLMSFGFLFAWLFRGPAWQKVLLVLSTIPIAVLMNCIRIGVIGILVEHQGTAAAEGFLHDFEGWLVFMACVGLLFLEVWLLSWITGRPIAFRSAFAGGAGGAAGAPAPWANGPSTSLLIATTMVVALASVAFMFQQRPELVPEPRPLALFPTRLGPWTGHPQPLGAGYVTSLQLDDYLLTNFVRDGGQAPVNLYMAYYGSQRSGVASHSPRSCIPGGGWHMSPVELRRLDGIGAKGQPLSVNRVVISKDRDRQLVYYWFEQRGRVLTNEYLVKWYILWDALTRNRTDGALVRLVTPIRPGEAATNADLRMRDFLRRAYPEIRAALPQ